MSNVYFISDLHLFHKNVIKFRSEFSSNSEHDSYIINRIYESLGKKDTLYILGDAFLVNNTDEIELAKKVLIYLDSKVSSIKFVIGNHCTDNEFRLEFSKWLSSNFEVHSLLKYKKFWLSHAPIHPAELRGNVNIHGHVHTGTIDDSRYFNVSCENIDYKPISLNEVKERLQK